MPKDKKYNPVAITEGLVLFAIIVISIVSAVILSICNYFHLL